jgi:hypothetical protein
MAKLTRKEVAVEVKRLLEDALEQVDGGGIAKRDRWEGASEFIDMASGRVNAVLNAPVSVSKVEPDDGNPRFSSSLRKGLRILSLFPDTTTLLGVTQIAEQLRMSPSTVHRYCVTLVMLGQLEQASGSARKYRRPQIVDAL